ncbi:hypothetical protein P171DRAFT_495053 [Karstenula rhodostoma CBS 690.94]|uniref:DUF6604 domain-containing protein n=1 Tax=Karstenula rhodostoma CBS 690.94 TaxID=1392251 RepID=A0A9P4PG51_9PLEO|nr:hypothetical protein P171DRAFT_495053 [Karstenula rhodostoma CBS 690.94]
MSAISSGVVPTCWLRTIPPVLRKWSEPRRCRIGTTTPLIFKFPVTTLSRCGASIHTYRIPRAPSVFCELFDITRPFPDAYGHPRAPPYCLPRLRDPHMPLSSRSTPSREPPTASAKHTRPLSLSKISHKNPSPNIKTILDANHKDLSVHNLPQNNPSMPARELFDPSVHAHIQARAATYQKATVQVFHWIITNSNVPVPTYPGPKKQYVKMSALVRAANDIALRKVCAPPAIRRILTTAIKLREEVTAKYRQREGNSVSQSTLGHERFTAALREIQGELEAVPMPPKPSKPTSRKDTPGFAVYRHSFSTLATDNDSGDDNQRDQDDQDGFQPLEVESDDLLQEMLLAAWIMQIAHFLQQAVYGGNRPVLTTDMGWRNSSGEYHGPSVVHRYPHPLEKDEEASQDEIHTGSFQFLQALRETSPNSASLPPIETWTVVEITEQMHLTAHREFSGDEPLARVNFIAIFLFCAEVLRKLQDCENVAFTTHRASRAVERVEKALEELDAKGQAAFGSGPAAGLKATLETFDRRRCDETFSSEL